MKEIPFEDISKYHLDKKSLQKLLQSYKSFQASVEKDSTPMETVNDETKDSYLPSVVADNNLISPFLSSPQPNANEFPNYDLDADADISTDSDSFFPKLQPESPYYLLDRQIPYCSRSLAELSGAKQIFPISTVPPAAPTDQDQVNKEECGMNLPDQCNSQMLDKKDIKKNSNCVSDFNVEKLHTYDVLIYLILQDITKRKYQNSVKEEKVQKQRAKKRKLKHTPNQYIDLTRN